MEPAFAWRAQIIVRGSLDREYAPARDLNAFQCSLYLLSTRFLLSIIGKVLISLKEVPFFHSQDEPGILFLYGLPAA